MGTPTNKAKTKRKDQGTTAYAPAKQRRARTMKTTTTDAQAFDESWSATAVFTVSGEPLGSAFLQGNVARIVPPPATSATPQSTQEQPKQRRYVFIGKPLEAWGRIVLLPDPEPEQKKTTKGKGKTTMMAMAHAGRKGKRLRFFVGSLEQLLAVRRRRRNRRRSASLSALNDAREANFDDGDEDGNPDEGGESMSMQTMTGSGRRCMWYRLSR